MINKTVLTILTIFSFTIASQGSTNDNGSPIDFAKISANPASPAVKTLGSVMGEDGYEFELQLNSKGASIEYARLTNHFERGQEQTPLLLLSPTMNEDKQSIMSLANTYLSFEGFEGKFPLHRLNWAAENKTFTDNGEKLSFTTNLFVPEYGDVLKLTKTYKTAKESQHIEMSFSIENLTDEPLKINFEIQSAVGVMREEIRTDMRSITAAFSSPEGVIKSTKHQFSKIREAYIKYLQSDDISDLGDSYIEKPTSTAKLEWASVGNKYFAAIIHPYETTNENPAIIRCEYYDSKITKGLSVKQQPKANNTESIGFKLEYTQVELAPKGTSEATKKFDYMLYLGPKDKSLFEENETYNQLGFVHAIDFQACCGNLFRPLSFLILAIMKAGYQIIPNYGIIIILLVLLVRLLLHPLTKKSQVSMMKMGKLGPKVEEIKAKYSSNPSEMNKRVMELYKEQGANPMLGFMPMLVQMPIWISLYSAIYASIDLRGAKFLPFWITDLSSQDMLFSFTPIIIPLVNWELSSLNLLPILLAVAMFMQQKLMSSSQPASMSPQMAQQQKMMLFMMPIMMLIFLYKAPSGLNLYIMASTFAGVIEQKVIKKHIREQEEKEKFGKVPVTAKTGGKVKKKKPKPMFKS